jgi:hypothetical protein
MPFNSERCRVWRRGVCRVVELNISDATNGAFFISGPPDTAVRESPEPHHRVDLTQRLGNPVDVFRIDVAERYYVRNTHSLNDKNYSDRLSRWQFSV